MRNILITFCFSLALLAMLGDRPVFALERPTQAVDDLTVALDEAQLVLSWTAPDAQPDRTYFVYRDTEPYFMPVPNKLIGTTVETMYVDPTAGIDNPEINHFYTVLTQGENTLDEIRFVGEWEWDIEVLPGQWLELSMPLEAADQGFDAIFSDRLVGGDGPLSADNIYTWSVDQLFTASWFCSGPICESWGEPWANHWLYFDYSPSLDLLEAGSAFKLRRQVGGGHHVLTLTGLAPQKGSVNFVPAAEGDWTFESLPLYGGKVDSAQKISRLAQTAKKILKWEAETQAYLCYIPQGSSAQCLTGEVPFNFAVKPADSFWMLW